MEIGRDGKQAGPRGVRFGRGALAGALRVDKMQQRRRSCHGY